MSKISVFMADGSEEVECLAVVDVARRAGIEVQTVSVTGRPELVRRFAAEGKRVAALCAAPSVLGRLGLLEGRTATCHPGWEDKLLGAEYTRQGVVTDGNITTGRGVGFAIDMGLELVRLLKGDDFAADLRRRVQYPGC